MSETSHLTRGRQFGWRIRTLRRQHGWSRAQLGLLLGLSERQTRRIENAERNVYLEEALMLSKIFNVSLDYLAGVSDDPHAR